MLIVLCRKCAAPMDWQVQAEHVTAGCPCGARIAAQYVFLWKQIPAVLRPQAIKAFGTHGKWRIQPLAALAHALRQHAAEYAFGSAGASAG